MTGELLAGDHVLTMIHQYVQRAAGALTFELAGAGLKTGAAQTWDVLSTGSDGSQQVGAGLDGAGSNQLKITPLMIPGGPSQPLAIPGGSGGGTPASALQLGAAGTQSHSSGAVAFSPGLGASSAVGSYQSGAGSFTGGSPTCAVVAAPPVRLFQPRSSPSQPVPMPSASAAAFQNGFHPAGPAGTAPAAGESNGHAAASLRASSLPGMHGAMYRALAGSSPAANGQQALPPRPPFRPSPSLPISRLSAGSVPAAGNGGGSSVDRSPSSFGRGASAAGTGRLYDASPHENGLSIAPLAFKTPFGRGPANGSSAIAGFSSSMPKLVNGGSGAPVTADASGSSAASTLTGILVGSLGDGQPR